MAAPASDMPQTDTVSGTMSSQPVRHQAQYSATTIHQLAPSTLLHGSGCSELQGYAFPPFSKVQTEGATNDSPGGTSVANPGMVSTAFGVASGPTNPPANA